MRYYTKDGITKPQNKIVLIKNGMQTINPPHNMLIAAGWVEYVEPQPTAEQLLEDAKMRAVGDINAYDSSSKVNEFYIGDTAVWLDKATRTGLKLRFEAEIAVGKTTTTLWYNSKQFTLELSQAMQMLYAIEIYASACYDCTQQHIANVNAMSTIEEVEQYNYNSGYPEKLHF